MSRGQRQVTLPLTSVSSFANRNNNTSQVCGRTISEKARETPHPSVVWHLIGSQSMSVSSFFGGETIKLILDPTQEPGKLICLRPLACGSLGIKQNSNQEGPATLGEPPSSTQYPHSFPGLTSRASNKHGS